MNTGNARLVVFAVLAAATFGSLACQNKAKPTTVPEVRPVQAEEAPKKPPTPETAEPTAEPFPPTAVEREPIVEPSIEQLNRDGVLRTVYFAYNSNEIDDDAKAILQANAAWLTSHPNHTVEIGGHCDERGSIGYNVALGDRRAAAVKEYLTGLGVSGAQLIAVSYGEEKPLDPAHNEAAWAKNRRAEFTIES
jgi:peptidoglycan-associated lipoprotein